MPSSPNFSQIDFSTPQWLINYYYIVGFVSVCLNSFGIYLIVFHCRQLDKYRYFLLFFQAFLLGLIIVVLETLLLSFQYKHQSIAVIIQIHVFPKWFLIFGYSFCLTTPNVMMFWFSLMAMSREEQLEYVKEVYPNLLEKFSALPNSLVYRSTISLDLFLLSLLFGCLLALILFTSLLVDLMNMMKIVKTKISRANLKKHQHAVRSLQIQFTVAMFCFAPPGTVIFVAFLEFANAQLLTEIAIAWYGMHAMLNMCSMLLFFPPYRSFLKNKMQKNVTDIHLTFLFQVVPLYPMLAGYSVGWLTTVFKESMLFSMDFLIVSVILMIQSLLLCAQQKHQSLAAIIRRHVWPKWFSFLQNSATVIIPTIVFIWFPLMAMNRNEQLEFVRQEYPQLFDKFFLLPNSIVFEASIWLDLFFVCLLTGFVIFFIFFTAYIIDLISMMKTVQTKVSKKSLQKHQDAIRSLQIQFATATFCFAPQGAVTLIAFLQLENGQLYTELAIAWYCLHAIINMSCMLLFFPPYQVFLKKKLQKK
ncbi:CBN-SRI-65 protein [Caenorhabditis brenneri]|uniref:CBN-SRI-65 protein n=1 Tax=Caenorhabditis brenneri TaxID=135651 RepID=G0NHL6_CAEBE|nr:CBN-SRI-65 protein [Caenorhabditis brenneri]